jgi:hypothetical protein
MAKTNRWISAAVAAAFAFSPVAVLAKNGADDLVPQAPKPQKPERPGHAIAKNGADDLVPQAPKPQKPERPGHAIA